MYDNLLSLTCITDFNVVGFFVRNLSGNHDPFTVFICRFCVGLRFSIVNCL